MLWQSRRRHTLRDAAAIVPTGPRSGAEASNSVILRASCQSSTSHPSTRAFALLLGGLVVGAHQLNAFYKVAIRPDKVCPIFLHGGNSLRKKLRQLETASHISEWLSSPRTTNPDMTGP